MKTPKEIKKGLKCRIRSFSDTCDNRCGGCSLYVDGYTILSIYKDALAYIQQLEPQVPRWISVEERMPDEGEKVIVRGVRGGIQAGTYKGHSTIGKNVWWWAHNTYLKVACWMPESMLPEAPKEERE